MNIKQNQHIKCIFRNGTIIEGIVQSHSKEELTLLSLHDDSLMVILHPNDDIMLIKIMPNKPAPKETPIQENISNKLKEVQAIEDPNLQNKTIAELKELADKQEKQIIANKIREHFPKGVSRSNYGSQSAILRKP